ncbi:NAD(P)-binding domain-containing protein, partial [Pseudomonas sp. JAI120]|uniref:NAD(P)-binding domain-containing protein n=1 Tax=Pseudomonas sp. JAI120 TaxID=2723063 RepID=UPI0030ECDECB
MRNEHMRIAMIGLGRMGANIARRLMRGGHEIVAFDRNPPLVDMLAGEGATAAASLEEVAAKLESPRIFWVMLPAGPPTESTIETLMGLASPGDIIIDGGNSFYKDDIRRAKMLAEKGIHYIDVGTSGGVWGLERGFCMMVGGDKGSVDLIDPILAALAPGIGTIP